MKPPHRSLEILPEGTIEHDFRLLEKYQAFSAEILRIALLLFAGIGLLIKELLLEKDKEGQVYGLRLDACGLGWLEVSLGLLAAAAAFALAHRYLSADSVAWLLSWQRMLLHGSNSPSSTARERKQLRLRLILSKASLAAAAACLALGTCSMAPVLIQGLTNSGRMPFQPSSGYLSLTIFFIALLAGTIGALLLCLQDPPGDKASASPEIPPPGPSPSP